MVSSPPPAQSYHFGNNFQPQLRYQAPVTIQFNQGPSLIQNHKVTYVSPPFLQQSINKQILISTNPQPQNVIFPLRTINQGTKIICP